MDLDPNCLQKLSADRVKWIVKRIYIKNAQNYFTLSGAVVLVYTDVYHMTSRLGVK